MKFKRPLLPRATHNYHYLENSEERPESWGYVEVLVNPKLVETHFARSCTPHGGQAYAYDKVKQVKGKISQAHHGVVNEGELEIVESYDPKTRKWAEPQR